MASRKAEKEKRRQERLAAEREAAVKAAKRRRLQIGGGTAALIVVGVVVAVAAASSGGGGSGGSGRVSTTSAKTLGNLRPAPSPGPLGSERIPIPQAPSLAPLSSATTGQTVDGIECNSSEQALFHIHARLTIFVNGSARQVPQGVGFFDSTCLYWLHTHAADGIIHVESPVQRDFTLGDFFDIWRQPLGPSQVGPVHGKVTAFYNGALYTGDPRNIPLNSYTQIQLDVGSPLIAPETVSFAGTGL